MAEHKVRIAAMADIHYGKHSRGQLHDVFAEISQSADVLLLCGDLTDFGLAEEADQLVSDLRTAVRIPMIGVLGNHDFESGELFKVSRNRWAPAPPALRCIRQLSEVRSA